MHIPIDVALLLVCHAIRIVVQSSDNHGQTHGIVELSFVSASAILQHQRGQQYDVRICSKGSSCIEMKWTPAMAYTVPRNERETTVVMLASDSR